MRLWQLGLVWVLTGCAQVTTTYTPSKAVYADGVRPTVNIASVAYQGDMPALMQAGGEVIGRMEGTAGASVEEAALRERIRIDAAARGATHVVFETTREQAAPPTGMVQGGGTGAPRSRVIFVLIRVPTERWATLPESLQATPLPARTPEPTTTATASGSSPQGAASGSLANTLQRARLRKQRAIEQARRSCYDQAHAQFGTQLDTDDEAALDAAATSQVDAEQIRQFGTPSSPPPEGAASGPQRAPVMDWFETCVRSEVAELEDR